MGRQYSANASESPDGCADQQRAPTRPGPAAGPPRVDIARRRPLLLMPPESAARFFTHMIAGSFQFALRRRSRM